MSINLVSWRQQRRQRVQQDFLAHIGLAVVVGLVVVAILGVVLGLARSGQKDRNAYLKQQISSAKKDIASIRKLDEQKNSLLARKDVIEKLQSDRDEMAHVFYELAARANNGILLTGLGDHKDVLEIKGRASSNSNVAQYARALERSPWLKNPDIIVIKTHGSKNSGKVSGFPYDFVLHASLRNPNAPAPEPKKIRHHKN